MRLHRSFLTAVIGLSLIATSCGSEPTALASTEASSANAAVERVVEEEVSSEPVAVDEVELEADPVDDTTTTEPAVEETTTTTTSEPEVSCVSPVGEERWVDVDVDDPDGGLNIRDNAGVSGSVQWTMPRGTTVVVTDQCETVGATDWWFVRPVVEADLNGGWVSSKFLSTDPSTQFSPGLGKAINDTENVELKAETVEELAAKLAVIYGFDEDVTITEVGETEIHDAIGGDAVYDLTGAKDDASDGKRVAISFWVDRSADGNEFFGFIAKRIITQELCTRGVTEDGLCI